LQADKQFSPSPYGVFRGLGLYERGISNDEVIGKCSIGCLEIGWCLRNSFHLLDLQNNIAWLITCLLSKFHKTTDSLAKLLNNNRFKDLYHKITDLVYPDRKTID
jgi:hypothetical protein